MKVKSLYLAGLTALFLCQSSIDQEFIEVAGLKLKQTREFLSESKTAYHLPRDDLVRVLSAMSNQEEFQVAYLPKEEILINLTLRREIQGSELDLNILDSLISFKEEFYLIHNHSNIDLDPRKNEINPLYWLAPSPKDIRQYIFIGSTYLNFNYGIITLYGLLDIKTDKETFSYINNSRFDRMIDEEAWYIQASLSGVSIDNLQLWADRYRGVLKLSFEKVK